MSGKNQWKLVEKRHAELFGADRVKTTFPAMFRMGGLHGKNYPDWLDEFIAGESKSQDKPIPGWLREAVDQAIDNERSFSMDGDGRQRVPIAVIHRNKDSYNDDIVCIRADVFREFILPAIHALGKVIQMSWDAERRT